VATETKEEKGPEARKELGDPSKHLVPQAANLADPVYFQNSDGLITAVEFESDMYHRYQRMSEWRQIDPETAQRMTGPPPEGERFSFNTNADNPRAEGYVPSTSPADRPADEDQLELDRLQQHPEEGDPDWEEAQPVTSDTEGVRIREAEEQIRIQRQAEKNVKAGDKESSK